MADSYRQQVAATLEAFSKGGGFADNVLKNIPLLKHLQDKGNVMEYDGGRYIEQPLDIAENGTFQWYAGSEQYNVNESVVLDHADYNWKQAATSVVLTGLEERINSSSKFRKQDLLKAKIKNAQSTMKNNVSVALFGDGTASAGKAIGGLKLLVADDPTTGTVGGIDASLTENAKWRNQVYDFSTLSKTQNAAGQYEAMRAMALMTQRGTDYVKLIVAGLNAYTLYEEYCASKKAINDDNRGDGGVGAKIFFNGVPVIYDVNCDTNYMYFLNTDYLFLKVHPDANFSLDKEKMSFNQDASVYPIYFMGNMTCSNRSLQGVIKP